MYTFVNKFLQNQCFMAKKILIPIDFKVESLNTLKYALKDIKEEVEVVLMYSEHLTDSITDLIFYSPDDRRKALNTAEFEEGLGILQTRFESVLTKTVIKFFHGYNANAFRSFVVGCNIDSIYIPKNFRLQLAENGFDPIPIIRRSSLSFQEIEWEETADSSISNLSKLFI